MNYGDQIKELRKSAGISQTTMAEKCGISQASYCEQEKRAEPPISFLRKSLAVLAPEMKLFEFIADPEDLEKYIPSWIFPEDLEMLRALYDLPLETRIKIRKLWVDSVEIAFDLKKN